jgi:hypothetical protein
LFLLFPLSRESASPSASAAPPSLHSTIDFIHPIAPHDLRSSSRDTPIPLPPAAAWPSPKPYRTPTTYTPASSVLSNASRAAAGCTPTAGKLPPPLPSAAAVPNPIRCPVRRHHPGMSPPPLQRRLTHREPPPAAASHAPLSPSAAVYSFLPRSGSIDMALHQ